MKFLARLSCAVLLSSTCLLFAPGCRQATNGPSHGPQLTLLYNIEEESAEKSAVAQIIQSQLANAGIQATLQPVSNSVFYQRIGNGDYQCALALWYLDYDDPEGFLTDFYSKAGFRMAGYNSAAYDTTYRAGLLASTSAEKHSAFEQAQSILLKDLPWVPIYSNRELFLLPHGAVGFRSNAYQYYDFRHVDLSSVRVASNVQPQTFDPAQAYDLASKEVVTQSYEGLVAMDQNHRIVPSLASSWKISQNSDRLTFTLRNGVRFHGNFGTLSAADVKASFERMLRDHSPYSYIFDYVAGVDDFRGGRAQHVSGFQVDGPFVFSIHLTRPFPTMLTWLLAPASYILPATLPVNFDFTKRSAGTGAFVLNKWDGNVAEFDANHAYWAKAENGDLLPKPKSLSIRVMHDVNATLTAFQQGDLDILNISFALFNEVFDKDGKLKSKYASYEFRQVPLNNLKFLSFRMGSTPWGIDEELRRKVSEAINRDVIVRNLFRGYARSETTIIPSGMDNW